MAARGTVAKQEVTEKLREVFGDNFIGEHEKKIYVWANDGGDRVQIAITLTCPKVQIETGEVSADSDSAFPTTASAQSIEFTDQEKKNLEDLMARLNL